MCKRDICIYHPFDEGEIPTKKEYSKGPKEIQLCYDGECNYICETCRDEYFKNSPEQLAMLDNNVTPKILKIAKNLEHISLSGGDPLASRHSRKLISKIVKENPDLKLRVCTQGYFLDEKNMKELGVTRIHRAAVSVHAATRETYKKIMRLDAFDKIMKNLKFLANWKKQGKVDYIVMNFVVHSGNYREMEDFVKLAKSFDATAYFTTYQPWPTAAMHKRYKEVAVFEPYHKDYEELRTMLHNPVFQSFHCILNPHLLKMAMS